MGPQAIGNQTCGNRLSSSKPHEKKFGARTVEVSFKNYEEGALPASPASTLVADGGL
jgi:hypothetical protein